MLLSRKRARESTLDTSVLLRDLVNVDSNRSNDRHHDHTSSNTNSNNSDELLELLRRLHQTGGNTSNAPRDRSLESSRARLSSQQLFLSVVLEWQRSQDGEEAVSPTAALFRHDQRFHAVKDEKNYPPSSSTSSNGSSYASSDEEEENKVSYHPLRRPSMKSPPSIEDVSPSSVHIVPERHLIPLHLDAFATKKIGVYTPRSRLELLRKYKAKRLRRLSQSKVRYGVRKTLANARPRVKGRFVKTEQPLTAALVHSQTTTANVMPFQV